VKYLIVAVVSNQRCVISIVIVLNTKPFVQWVQQLYNCDGWRAELEGTDTCFVLLTPGFNTAVYKGEAPVVSWKAV
jgi:hypothetical protein